MLSIAVLKTATDAVNYYEKDDYYTGAEDPLEAQGAWVGNAAAELGLGGLVERKAFQAMLSGKLPNGEVLGRKRDDKIEHTPGWDLTFSAPKSVSLLYEVGGDDRLLEAHHAAVRVALDWAERNAIGTRQKTGAGTIFVRTYSMVAGVFTHHTSRNQDPQLHSHAVIANATRRPDGKWASLHSQELFDNKMAMGMVYRSEYVRLIVEMGYPVKKTHRDGRFEVVGIPYDLLRSMSKRREEVESKLGQWGATGAVASARATVATRQRKEDISRSELVRIWNEEVNQNDFSIQEIVDKSYEDGPQKAPRCPPLQVAVKDGVDRLSEAEAVFTHGELVREVLIATIGTFTVEQVEAAIRDVLPTIAKLQRADAGGRKQWTTAAAVSQERISVETMLAQQQTMTSIDRAAHVQQWLDNYALNFPPEKRLNASQRQAIEFALTTTDQFPGIVGWAGTGKTTMMKAMALLAQKRGFTVLGMAQGGNAAQVLQREGGFDAHTIHKFLRLVGDDIAKIRTAPPLFKKWIQFKNRDQLWVVDEASQLPNYLARRVLFAAEQLGARVLFVGDTKQLPAIEAGKPFSIFLQRGMRHFEMNDIIRQNNVDHIEIIRNVMRNKIGSAMKLLNTVTTETPEAEERLEKMLELWNSMGEEREKTLLLTARNREKTALNDGVRKILRGEGKIQNEQPREVLDKAWGRRADKRSADFYRAGDVVLFPRNVREMGIKRNSYFVVIAVSEDENVITLQPAHDTSAPSIQWNPRELSGGRRWNVQVYKRRETTLAVGEIVRWGNNDNNFKLANGEILRVVAADEKSTTFKKEDGKLVIINHDQLAAQHWDHAYASTVYSAQGRTSLNTILNAESDRDELFSMKAFLVAISRHRANLFVLTDDRQELEKTLKAHLGEKTSALEAKERMHAIDADPIAQQIQKDSEARLLQLQQLQEAEKPPPAPAREPALSR